MRWIAAALALATALAMAQIDTKADGLLAKMRAAYSSVTSARVSITYVQIGGAGKSVTIKSQCLFSAPNFVRVESTGLAKLPKTGYVLVADGKQIHIEGLPGGSFTTAYTKRQVVQSLPDTNLEVISFWDWQRQLSTGQGGNMRQSTFKLSSSDWNGKTYTVLEETARGQGVRVRYYIDPKTFIIWRTEQFDLNATEPYITSSVDKMELNVPVDPASFKITSTAKN